MADIRINALATTAASTASDDFIAVDGSANGTRKLNAFSPTFGGNLTVSGTGTSSVAGNLFVGTTTAAASGARLQAQLTGTDGTVSTLLSLRKNTNAAGTGVAIDFTPDSTDNPLAKLSAVRTSLVFGYTDFRFSTWNGSAFTEQLRLVGQTGNLLLKSDGVDSGNGKLQLATHTTSAGGIGFGTDTSLYRVGAGILYLSDGTNAMQFASDSGGAYVSSIGSRSLILRSNSTTALTLDSSQNTTAAGWVKATSFQISTDSQGTVLQSSGNTLFIDSSAGDVKVRPKNSVGNFIIANGAKLIVDASFTPASASATGTAGSITWDSSYIYVCTATNTWKRVAIATW